METAHANASRPLLLVDDDELELSLLADRLSAAGYQVATAHSGEQARELLEKQSFPVIVTDYQMPVMDGLELVDSIRNQSSSGDWQTGSYVIVWSVRSAEEDRDRSFSHGVDDHVAKSSSDAELLSSIATGFHTMQLRAALQRTRNLRTTPAVVERSSEVDVWNAAAGRLHGEIARAERNRLPLTVLMLHVEHALTQDSQVGSDGEHFAARQLACLSGAVNSVIRRSFDWVAPLDVASGLARVLVVLPETGANNVSVIKERIHAAIADLSITDEFAELSPECAVGVATIDSWTRDLAPNAASLVAAAERQVVKLSQDVEWVN